jgi:hypothetical protein
MSRWHLAAVAGLMLAAPAARAQGTPPSNDSGPTGRLIGRVLYREGDNGVPYATVTLTPPGTTRFADSSGAFAFPRVTPGTYHLRARQIGYSPFDTSVQVLPPPAITNVTLRLRHVIRLAQITVRAKAPRGCAAPGLPDSLVDPALYLVFTQMRENVFRLRILMNDYPFRDRRIDDFIDREAGGDRRVETDTVEEESWDIPDYRPGEVLTNGFDSRGRPGQYFRLVQFQDLTERQFVENHCFHMADDPSGLARIDFVPADRLLFPDVEGSVYLDPERMIVRHATFHLTRPHMARPPIRDWTYGSTFSEVVPMVPVVDRFHSIVMVPWRIGPQIEDGHVVDYSFIREAPVNPDIRDTLAGPAGVKTIVAQATFGNSESGQHCAPPAPQPFTEALTGTILAYADSAASPNWRAGAKALLSQILAKLAMPTTVELTTVGYPVPASAQDAAGRGALRVAPGIFGRYAFDLDARGMVYEVRVASTSLSSDVDSALVQAIRGARTDKLHGQTIVLSISTAGASDTSLSMQLAHIQVPSWLLARSASWTPPATATPTAGSPTPGDTASFEFIVDEAGHPVLATVHRIGWPTEMDQLTEGAADSLSNRNYRPALVGRCAVSQVSIQRFDFQHQQ